MTRVVVFFSNVSDNLSEPSAQYDHVPGGFCWGSECINSELWIGRWLHSGRTCFGCGSWASARTFHTSHSVRLAERTCRPLCNLEEIQQVFRRDTNHIWITAVITVAALFMHSNIHNSSVMTWVQCFTSFAWICKFASFGRINYLDMPAAVQHLREPDHDLQVLGAAYIQHECYNDNEAKNEVLETTSICGSNSSGSPSAIPVGKRSQFSVMDDFWRLLCFCFWCASVGPRCFLSLL